MSSPIPTKKQLMSKLEEARGSIDSAIEEACGRKSNDGKHYINNNAVTYCIRDAIDCLLSVLNVDDNLGYGSVEETNE